MWLLKIKTVIESYIKITSDEISCISPLIWFSFLLLLSVCEMDFVCTYLPCRSTNGFLIICVLSSDRSPLLLFFSSLLSPQAFPPSSPGIQRANKLNQVEGGLQSLRILGLGLAWL